MFIFYSWKWNIIVYMPKGNKVSRETKVINQPTLGEEDYTCLSRWGQYKHKDLQV